VEPRLLLRLAVLLGELPSILFFGDLRGHHVEDVPPNRRS
jgi:hypothetical protein